MSLTVNYRHINNTRRSILALFCFLFLLSGVGFSQPAFPGAAGFGSETAGGRGGKIIEVTNLNDKGVGSFRAACEANGARIIVFTVGGTILMTKNIEIDNPYITIAGQTAPGDGICLRGATLGISTHDVILRGLRFRVGDDPDGPNPDNRDGIDIANRNDEPYNIIIDHCSISWAIDGNLDLWYPCRDITIQWCILSESLHKSLHSKGPHGTALLIGDHAKQISIHHNLFAHNNGRNPLMKFDTETEVINNVIYNWGSWGSTAFSNYEEEDYIHIANIIGNYYHEGLRGSGKKPISITSDKIRAGTMVYVKGNIGPGRLTDDLDDWRLVDGGKQFRVDEPAMPLSNVTISSAFDAYDMVLNNAGAFPAQRDTVDARVIQSVRDKTGAFIDSQDEVGGWPDYDMGTAPTDSDHDGMPDNWEESNGLNPNDPADAHGTDLSDEGYTNVEVYINGLYQFITTRVERRDTMTPKKISLEQNYPNPFNPATSIVYTLPEPGYAVLKVFNIHGRLVKTLGDVQQSAGQHVVQWDGRDEDGLAAASGLYFYKLQAGQQVITRKMMLVR